MEIAGKNIVVTGAASGIGRALARRFAADGARGVVFADLDQAKIDGALPEGVENVLGVACDVSDPGANEDLIAAASKAFGPVDIFCANAGIGVGMGLDTPDDVWEKVMGVNTHAHVYAARLLVPGWVERGEGYFVSTASAAGLLSVIGDASYALSKHAAVGFAEWLSITYGDQGVRVSCLCPMGVQTPLLEAGLEAEGEGRAGVAITVTAGTVLSPDDVAAAVVEGIAAERFLILPHPEVHHMLKGKVADHDNWLAAMRHIRASVVDTR